MYKYSWNVIQVSVWYMSKEELFSHKFLTLEDSGIRCEEWKLEFLHRRFVVYYKPRQTITFNFYVKWCSFKMNKIKINSINISLNRSGSFVSYVSIVSNYFPQSVHVFVIWSIHNIRYIILLKVILRDNISWLGILINRSLYTN